jgi:DNA-binding CsgD family transcriptional regulator
MRASENEATSTRERVLARTLDGRSARQIALELGLSTQAIYWHLERLRASGELPDPRREGAA